MQEKFQIVSRITAIGAALIGGMSLMGWAWTIPQLTQVIPGSTPMTFNTAWGFIVAGLLLACVGLKPTRLWQRIIMHGCATAILALGTLTLSEYLFQWNPGIGQTLFTHANWPAHENPPGGMSTTAALNFVLLGLAIFAFLRDRWVGIGQILVSLVGVLGWLAIIGYLYGIRSFYQFGPSAPMAIHTGVAFCLLTGACLCGRPDRGVMAIIASETLTGHWARWLLPIVLMAPALLGWLHLMGEWHDFYDTPAGVGWLALTTTFLFTILILVNIRREFALEISRLEAEADAKRAESELRQRNERLRLISEVARHLLQANTREGLIQTIFNKLAPHLPVDVYFGFQADEPRKALELQACTGISEEVARGISRVPFGQAVCGTVAQQQSAIVTTHIQQSTDPKVEPYRRLGLRAYACFPLLVDHRLSGTLGFGSHKVDAFTPEDLEFFQTITDHAALALDRLRASEEMRESEHRFHEIAASIGEVFWLLEMNPERVAYVSPAWERLWQHSRNELYANPRLWMDTISSKDRCQVEQSFSQWLAAGCPGRWEIEYRLAQPHGGIRWIHDSAAPVDHPNDRVRRVAGMAVDITERKLAEEALRKTKEELARVNANLEHTVQERTHKLQESITELEHFSYSITHDMRAPLRAMRGFATLLLAEGGSFNATTIDYLERISSAADRMDHLITDALDYSKIVRQEMPLVPVNAGALLQEMIETYPSYQAPHANICIEPGIPSVLANKAALTQCFSNLLGNAVKFVKEGQVPHVRVWGERRDAYVRLWFEDNGIGIPPQWQDRIFAMFQRVSRDYEGTGIGLALVRKAAERMGGKVGVESESGKGCRFWLELKRHT